MRRRSGKREAGLRPPGLDPMSATRTAPAWRPWKIRRGNNLPQAFRWVDDRGPVDMSGMELRLRITLGDGTLIEKQAGVDPEFILFDQSIEAERGFFSYQPSLQMTRDLPAEPAPKYEFEVRFEGLQQSIGEGQIVIRAGENADG